MRKLYWFVLVILTLGLVVPVTASAKCPNCGKQQVSKVDSGKQKKHGKKGKRGKHNKRNKHKGHKKGKHGKQGNKGKGHNKGHRENRK